LRKTLVAAKLVSLREADKRARAIYSAIVGALLMARSRADVTIYGNLIESYLSAGLLPA
jgi:TetR/AcrR family transcriptional repressor of nem operon